MLISLELYDLVSTFSIFDKSNMLYESPSSSRDLSITNIAAGLTNLYIFLNSLIVVLGFKQITHAPILQIENKSAKNSGSPP